jgi:hypothetical protein
MKALFQYQLHNASIIHSLIFSVGKKSVHNVDKLTLSVLIAADPINVSQSDVCTRPIIVFATLVQLMSLLEIAAIMPIITTICVAFGCLIQWHSERYVIG